MNLHKQNFVCWPSVGPQDIKQTYIHTYIHTYTPLCRAISTFRDWKLTVAFQFALCLKIEKLRSAELQFVSSAATFVVIFQSVSSSAHILALLQCFSSRRDAASIAAQSYLLCSSALHSVSLAAICQLSCNPSALACSVVQFICFQRPAVKRHLSYRL